MQKPLSTTTRLEEALEAVTATKYMINFDQGTEIPAKNVYRFFLEKSTKGHKLADFIVKNLPVVEASLSSGDGTDPKKDLIMNWAMDTANLLGQIKQGKLDESDPVGVAFKKYMADPAFTRFPTHEERNTSSLSIPRDERQFLLKALRDFDLMTVGLQQAIAIPTLARG